MRKLLRKHNTVTRGGTCRGRRRGGRRGGRRALDVRCAILLRDQPSELDAVKYSLATVNEVVLKISKNVSLQNKCHFREVHLYAFFVAVQSTFRRMNVRCSTSHNSQREKPFQKKNLLSMNKHGHEVLVGAAVGTPGMFDVR